MRSIQHLASTLVLVSLGCTDVETRCNAGFRLKADGARCVLLNADAGATDAADGSLAPDVSDAGTDVVQVSDVQDVLVDACAASDPPGDGLDQDCDGVDGTRGRVLFVFGGATGDEPGTDPMRPARSIARALSVAGSGGTVQSILVRGVDLTVTEPVTVTSGVSIYGGYAESWVARSGRTTVRSSATTALVARGVNAATTVSGFSFAQTGMNTPGFSNVAVTVIDSTALTLDDCELSAAAGRPGARGTDGADGMPSGNGQNNVDIAGGAGGVGCVAGGAGGTGTDTMFGAAGMPGGMSGSLAGGIGGAGGVQFMPGMPGLGGSDGAAGAGGASAGGASRYDAVMGFVSVVAASGTDGQAGSGGGGGGSASGVSARGGGGGGSGGCGGRGGSGGFSGGWSVALLARGASRVTLRGCALRAQDGGVGGDGGASGSGVMGGVGGSGSASTGASMGGLGGNGGRGAIGGAGSGGGGGSSYAVLTLGAATVTREATPTTTYAHGLAGDGGNAGMRGTTARAGASGAAGDEQNLPAP